MFNSSLSAGNIDEYIVLGKKEKSLMEKVYNKLGLSARGYHRILKVARTIADIDGSKDVEVRVNDQKRRQLKVGDTLLFLKPFEKYVINGSFFQ